MGRVSQVQAVLSSFEDISGIKILVCLLYLVLYLHKANEIRALLLVLLERVPGSLRCPGCLLGMFPTPAPKDCVLKRSDITAC